MKEKYTNAIGQLQKDVGASNVMQVPRIEKVVVNVGIGRISKESDKVKEVFEAVESIVGQTPIKTKAQRSIAGFKVREGQDVGIKVTLRGDRMWDFLTRLVGVALPRVRDFQGIALTAIEGYYKLGKKEKAHELSLKLIESYNKELTNFSNAIKGKQNISAYFNTIKPTVEFYQYVMNESEKTDTIFFKELRKGYDDAFSMLEKAMD